jgi:two-component system NarL family response regulator
VTSRSDPARILLADGHSLFREAVRVVLESQADMEVVAEARDGAQAVAEAEALIPDLAILDVNLPNCDGIRATHLIRERVPSCRVMLLAPEDDHDLLVDALEAGASGYLTKGSPLGELIEAARVVHAGETLVPRHMLGALLAGLIQRRRAEDHAARRMAGLTKREREVLALLARGADNDAIAQALVISPQTARTHIQNVLGKLGVHSRLEAAAFVIQNGVLDELAGA